MERTLLLRVKRNILPAVISFLFMTASTPIPSASFIYSIFSTSAMVFGTPIRLAATQVRILVSELLVTATKASHSFTFSSTRISVLRPSPFIASTLSPNFAARYSQRSCLCSIILMLSTAPSIFLARISPILPPPTIISFFISISGLPEKLRADSTPSLVHITKRRSFSMKRSC